MILIEEGDTVPADARLLQVTALQTAEASLTGESLPGRERRRADRGEVGLGDRHNMLFSGTAATRAWGGGGPAAGMRTEMGKIADLLQQFRARRRRSSGAPGRAANCWGSSS